MLVVTRREGESIVVTATRDIPAGSRMEIMLCSMGTKQTRIGIEADKRLFTIVRSELIEAVEGAALLTQQRHEAESATGTEKNG